MAFVACPSCGEKGRLPKQLIGHRVKCQKCGTSFLIEAPVKAAPHEPNAEAVGPEPVPARVLRFPIAIKSLSMVSTTGMEDDRRCPCREHARARRSGRG